MPETSHLTLLTLRTRGTGLREKHDLQGRGLGGMLHGSPPWRFAYAMPGSQPVLSQAHASSAAIDELERLKKEAEQIRIVNNERVKLTANFINTIAGALIVTGLFTPVFGEKLFEKLGQPTFWIQGLVGLLCLALAVILHMAGRAYLGTLK
ncbi:hypothetical protein [Methylobacterium sp. Gmos1]